MILYWNLKPFTYISNFYLYFLCCLVTLSVAVPTASHAYDNYFEKKTKECDQEANNNNVRCLEFLAGMALLTTFDKKEANKKAERLYKKALSIDPRDLSVLENLSRFYARQKRYKEAFDLNSRAIALQPSNLAVKLYRCMLEERMQYPQKDYMQCYRTVVKGYKKRNKTKGAPYVFVLIMANDPNVDKAINDFIESFKPGTSIRIKWEHKLRNASRSNLLNGAIP